MLTLAGCDGVTGDAANRGAPDAAPVAFRLCNGGSEAELTFLNAGDGPPEALQSNSCKRPDTQKVYDHLLRIQRELFDAGEQAARFVADCGPSRLQGRFSFDR